MNGFQKLNLKIQHTQFKFRVWDKNKKCYVNPSNFAISLEGVVLILYPEGKNSECYTIEGNFFDIKNQLFIIQRCIGLFDIKGKEIYEGDIVSDGKRQMKVYWEHYGARFQMVDINGHWDEIDYDTFNTGTHNTYEIIGNIFTIKNTKNKSDKFDLADKIAFQIDGELQRMGLGWPIHETAKIIRKVIKENE